MDSLVSCSRCVFPISFRWEVNVTTSIARGRNVLNFPRDYSRNCLLRSDNTIYMLEMSSGRVYKSAILTSSKNDEDRFIYSGWKRFVKENRLSYKDKVIFYARNGDNRLEVQIIRRPISFGIPD
ncbi:unnamed protein product [Trifolium pratense]|uniref:Uncharacterized protein n=1 Tax=Trifolium pratense TaxID=57577 RepID=A0ACB0IJC3_TRIPR|nr:unnamed protein product [Trifolium pratense]